MGEFTHIPTAQLLKIKSSVEAEIRNRKLGKISPIDVWKNFVPEYSYDSQELLSVPGTVFKSPPDCHSRLRYVKPILAQNWSFLFNGEEREDFYVYIHYDPRKKFFAFPTDIGGVVPGTPFYVGKGTAGRAWDLKRNQGHGKIIKQILADGYRPEDMIYIIKDKINEVSAYELESKLIYLLKTIYQNEYNGCLYNLEIPKTPEFIGVLPKFKTIVSIEKSYASLMNKKEREND